MKGHPRDHSAEIRDPGPETRGSGLDGTEIAVVGMAGRFPGAANLAEFWSNLRNGRESLSTFTAEELAEAGVPREIRETEGYVARRGVLDGAEMFDAGFFGYYPREAQILDPQQRVFLECAWEAMEDAAQDGSSTRARVGVFAGSSPSDYASLLRRHPGVMSTIDDFQFNLATSRDFLATRVSYALDLDGPAMTVQTGCSTSLVAVHLACQSLLTGDCDTALAGGVSIGVPQRVGYLPVAGGILSPDGHCRAFDARARGTVAGDGAGVVVLKRLEDALAARDPIRAVIRGSAVNNDGREKIGFTAPSVRGQAAAIRAAHLVAGTPPETIGYVEAHGTATPLGDPIEVAALTEAFGGGSGGRAWCGLGSVKTNIGHLDAAAGITGLIKTVLALEHEELPPSLHFERVNPEIKMDGGPFYVNARLREWRGVGGAPRRAGVSSFGIGGTNAHVVLEQAPPPSPSGSARDHQLLVLSAKSEPALREARARLARRLASGPPVLADAAYTLQTGRRAFEHRTALVCRTPEEAAARLTEEPADGPGFVADRPVVFMFPGGGAQRAGMGAGLYAGEPVFRDVVDRCARILRPHLGFDLRTVLYPEAFPGAGRAAGAELDDSVAFPAALFVVEYALARLWSHWGVRPRALIGHSLGEYTAACLAGVFSLEDALALIALRGRLFARLPVGAMLSVRMGADDLAPLLGPGLDLAAVNGPRSCVVSGPVGEIERIEARLAELDVEGRRLRISIAAHSRAVEPLLAEFGEFVGTLRLRPPSVPVISNRTGTWLTPGQATDPAYWTAHLRGTVRFGDGVATLLDDRDQAFVQVGPGWTLASFVRAGQGSGGPPLCVSSLPPEPEGAGEVATMLESLGTLWAGGVETDWAALHEGHVRARTSLPAYPFQHRRYWPDGPRTAGEPTAPLPGTTDLSGPPLGPAPAESDTARPGSGAHASGSGAAPAGPGGEVAGRLLDIWRDLFGTDLSVEDDFFALGGDSLLATRLLLRVNREFGVALMLKDLMAAPSVRRQAAAVARATAPGAKDTPAQDGASPQAGTPREDAREEGAREEGALPGIAADVRLDPSITVAADAPEGPEGDAVFLTGATGYLGAHLLRELLDRTPWQVRCLVRASTAAEGHRRVLGVLREHGLDGNVPGERIVAVPGDLSAPLLGLTEAAFDELARTTAAIYHCGARVHFTYPYASMRAANVLGTQEVLRLAARGPVTPVHHVSTTAVFPASGGGTEITEDTAPYPAESLATGYAQSKWAAERLVEAARERGIPVAVYRPGAVTGDTRTGLSRPDDAVWRMLKGCLQLGYAPDTPEGIVGAPADFVSAGIVHLSRRPASLGRNFHLIAPEPTPWPEVFEAARSMGYQVRTVSYQRWRRLLDGLTEPGPGGDEGNALFPLVHLFDPATAVVPDPVTCRATTASLSGGGVECPPLDADLFRRYVRHFIGTGFLAPPDRERDPAVPASISSISSGETA
ncbi:type I polyketide synthase [Sphaerisporangium corydalis]|uniref:Type I polyketide synthase n=1 Tax=Sphaerisporangium corydalis TaxID=1441875 RepID=A0ABV9ET52_9ACTN|nr:thioester reductase domain-containing protein [Sphaerisporangium corydalis]